MKNNSLPARKRIRLKEYDYSSANYYHVTICTYENKQFLVMGDNLTEIGLIVKKHIENIKNYYKNVHIDKYVIMPNHIHIIVVIESTMPDNKLNLGNIIGSFKAGVSREVHLANPELKMWQSRFYDHIIKDDSDYENVWLYIDENPKKWNNDDYYR